MKLASKVLKRIVIITPMADKEQLSGRRSPWLMREMVKRRKEHPNVLERLKMAEHRFEVAFENGSDAINITLKDGTFLAVNDSFSRMIGYTKEELEGHRSVDLDIWENMEDREKMLKELEDKGEVVGLKARFKRKDGSGFLGVMSATIINIRGRQINFSVVRDVTEQEKIEQERREFTMMLKRSHDQAIGGLVKMVDWKDRETEGHSERVSELTARLLKHIDKFSPEELEAYYRGALLHDIGKVGIPDSILLKEGELTPDEIVVMRKHPTMAYDLMSKSEYLAPSIDIPYCHHERWDGNGYPRGLKGEEIPLPARIFAVVDVWDALTSQRIYRPNVYSPDEAREIIIADAGKAFDPGVVKAFFEMLDDGQNNAKDGDTGIRRRVRDSNP